MYIMTVLTTMRNGISLMEIRDEIIDSFKWKKVGTELVFNYCNKCRWETLENDEYNEEYLIGLRAEK